MSWLSAVTGKAEDFLNRLDKSAADAFHIEEEVHNRTVSSPELVTSGHLHQSSQHTYKPLYAPSTSIPARNSNTGRLGQSLTTSAPHTTHLKSTTTTSTSAAAASSVSASSRTAGSGTVSSASSKSKQSSTKRQESDEALFDFLNSKDPSEGKRKRVAPAVTVKQQSRQADSELPGGQDSVRSVSVSSTPSVSGGTGWGSGGWSLTEYTGDALHTPSAEAGDTEGSADVGQRSSPAHSHESADPEALADAMKESPAGSVSSGSAGPGDPDYSHTGEAQLSALELENGLLKNEVASLNQEIASLIEHAKKSQTEVVRTKERLVQYEDRVAGHDQLVGELRARERDLQEAVRAKDSQLAVLRLQLENADRTSSSLHHELQALHTDRERMLQSQSSASGAQSQALDSLRQKLSDTEALLAREQHSHTQYQREAAERQSRMEQEEKTLADSLTAAEKRISEEKAKAVEAQGQLKTVKAMLDSTRQEMAEYKEKASRILQSKERLITSLRDGSEASGSVEGGGGVSSLEFEALQQERDMLREELHTTKMALDTLRTEMQDLEIQHQQESGLSQDNIHSLQERLATEQRHRHEVEQDLLLQKQDLQYTLDDLHRQKVNFQSRLSDREAEIEKLRGQLTTKSLSSTSESELESRVRSLTESLIQKQTTLESLSTENNSLTLQLERLGQQYRDAEHSLMRTAVASNRAGMGVPEDDMRHRLPTILREGVTDTGMTRKVKHYVNSIDRFSIRLGVFLRRYPMARIFVLFYMMALHLWVLVVLATHQQEIHES